MADKNGMELFSTLDGGRDTIQMLQRMERLKKLMGTGEAKQREERMEVRQEGAFLRSRREDMLSAALPFLDREYRKGLYVFVRMMEMRRVLGEGSLEARERQEEAEHPSVRRQKMLGAIQPYLSEREQRQMENILKMMTMREIMGREETK